MARDRDDAPAKGGAGKHLKRYGVFYAIALVVLIGAVALPAVSGDDDEDVEEAASTEGSTDDEGGADQDGPWRPASGDIEHGTGEESRAGVPCEEGEPQIPELQYTAPCLPVFEGDNGGETARGVTADTIKIVMKGFPSTANSQQVQAELEAAGLLTEDERHALRDTFIEYLNENYELYGRKVEIIKYDSKFSNGTQEALGQGREGACQDATYIADELGAFGVIGETGDLSGVFAECAAERDLVVFAGGAYFSEDWYRKWSPYVYSTTMSCDRVTAHVAEYADKRLAGKPAVYAGGELQGKDRKFGTYVPDNEEYVKCTEKRQELLREAGREPGSVVTYQLDISRFQDQANRAIIQFKAEGVTTIVTACDPFSLAALTRAAKEQDYFPEWFIIGTAAQDSDTLGRTYEQDVVRGRMFGISQLAATELITGPDSEAGKLYEKLEGEEIPGGNAAGYIHVFQHMFNLLQSAGPDLTPDNIAAGVATLPEMGGPNYPMGRWSFAAGLDGKPDHTARDDAREVYWDADAEPGPEEVDRTKRGRFLETDPGVRYPLGEWPEGDVEIPGAS